MKFGWLHLNSGIGLDHWSNLPAICKVQLSYRRTAPVRSRPQWLLRKLGAWPKPGPSNRSSGIKTTSNGNLSNSNLEMSGHVVCWWMLMADVCWSCSESISGQLFLMLRKALNPGFATAANRRCWCCPCKPESSWTRKPNQDTGAEEGFKCPVSVSKLCNWYTSNKLSAGKSSQLGLKMPPWSLKATREAVEVWIPAMRQHLPWGRWA